jgi:hypothetical protein
VDLPPTAQADQSYQIFDSQFQFTATAFEVSTLSCPITTYSASISPSDGDDFITFDPSNLQFTLQTDDNQYGDFTYVITLTANNGDGDSNSYSFNLITTKNCQYVTLLPTSFEFDSYQYMAYDLLLEIKYDLFT